MARSRDPITPRTFFLNEQHELSPSEKGGHGALPQYIGIQWATRAKQIHRSLQAVTTQIRASRDPLKNDRYFVLAAPVSELEKSSKNKKKAPKGTFKEKTSFGGAHSRVFDRLGLDLLQVTDDGKALVHAESEKFAQLVQRSESLASLGPREQSRWATIDSFDVIPLELRIDHDWLQSLDRGALIDVVFELQPVLSRMEADQVLHAIADLLFERDGGKLMGVGSDFSGRYWSRGRVARNLVRSIAKEFFSVQSIHSPLYSVAAGKATTSMKPQLPAIPSPERIAAMPCVAVVDLGVPADHPRLAPYRRGQFYPRDAPAAAIGSHGSFVASRIVFGDQAGHDQLFDKVNSGGDCRFYDAQVGEYPVITGRTDRVNDKIVLQAIDGVRGAAPDVRVFNLSIGDERPLHAYNGVDRREKLAQLRDLDNFIFSTDSIVIVAAGNSASGLVPTPGYPDHHMDSQWALQPWACGFNSWICGSFVARSTPGGLARGPGWPSPFTRIGPGLCDAPLPSFSAEGGDSDSAYRYGNGLGVWGLSDSGHGEDRCGTSHAAPVLAREAAFALQELQEHCAPGTTPFGVTARAFLVLTALPPIRNERIDELVKRTLGVGKATTTRLKVPRAGTAVLLWQGVIESPQDKIRVQLPIPLDWLHHARSPMLRLIVCSNPPVNDAPRNTWACRKIKAVLHSHPDAPGVHPPHGGHASYPAIDRTYKLARYKADGESPATDDLWLVELSYDEIAPYQAVMDFDARQRVAFAAELLDVGESPVDPQPAMQALPIAASMTRLSIQPVELRTPIILKTRVS